MYAPEGSYAKNAQPSVVVVCVSGTLGPVECHRDALLGRARGVEHQ